VIAYAGWKREYWRKMSTYILEDKSQKARVPLEEDTIGRG